ncbi:uncharacterized protein LOC119373432 [Rhipicephalus sanguineus]|uniref:uncharacterized protein LOC119373432 n=1 Tax=Rhipicephalus sanguineus TaxID=34632 RepID=UPI001895E425|nr:uncharacterized protein LOC119373432 [Rhipicephalus sanguineus]
MPTHAKEALLILSSIAVISVLAPEEVAALTDQDILNESEKSIPPTAVLPRAKRTVGCFDTTTSNGNLCYNAQCPFFSMGACKDGLCVCAPKGKNMAAIREVCYDSCYASCTQSCSMDDSIRASLKSPCDTQCTKLCYDD